MPQQPLKLGVVYDLATKKPVRCLIVNLLAQGPAQQFKTDDQGRYFFDISPRSVDSTSLVPAIMPGYRSGLVAEKNPPLLHLSPKARRDAADGWEQSFDPVLLTDEGDKKLVRFDLVAVPQPWPSDSSQGASAH